ncbi:hypothetical protein CVM73_19300 [Bradyrhizobium forestalis]|uniref:Plasmid pRiA4b Orf3-like domain-containing protein n=2 Tax=Bradyrhizobium forestalis TaxID=1419263 RepID=A0A2M8R736_9BRAD|nr:hypothetical protein CVM73_19300 [Bradyrhizobium forestalis]
MHMIRGWRHEPEHDRGPDQGDLKDVKPEVTRCLVVPLTLRLDRLHLTLQAAFGWTNSHLFELLAGEGRRGIWSRRTFWQSAHRCIARLGSSKIVQETGATTIHYLYDFGDS